MNAQDTSIVYAQCTGSLRSSLEFAVVALERALENDPGDAFAKTALKCARQSLAEVEDNLKKVHAN